MANDARIKLHIDSPDIDRIQKWFDELAAGKYGRVNVDADVRLAEAKIASLSARLIRLDNITINQSQFRKQLDNLKTYVTGLNFDIQFRANGLGAISNTLDRMEQQALTIADAFSRMNNSIVTPGDAIDRRYNNRIRNIESLFNASAASDDPEKVRRFADYVQDVRDAIVSIRAQYGNDNNAILLAGDEEIHRLREYMSLLSKLESLNFTEIQDLATGLESFRRQIPGAAARIDDLNDRLNNSIDDPLGLLRIQRELQNTQVEFADFVKRREQLNKTVQSAENDLSKGLFGEQGEQHWADAERQIESIKTSIQQLSADSSKADWLGVTEQIKKLETLKAKVADTLAVRKRTADKDALTADVENYRSTHSGISESYSQKLDELIAKIKTADSQTLANIRKEFTALKKEIDTAANGVDAQRDKLKVLIDEWEKLHPGSAKRLSDEIDEIRKAIDSADSAKLDNLKREFENVTSEASILGDITKSLGKSLKSAFDDLAPYALIARGGQMITNAFEESFDTLRSVDTYLTEISKVSSRTKSELDSLSGSAFESASKWGVDVTTYLQGAQEWSRSGYEEQSEALAELTVLAQSAGDMTSDVATSYLIATNAAYKYAGDAEALNAVLDGQNQITNRNAVSMQELAEATKIAGSQAASAGLEIDEFSAAVGTIQAVTQQGGSVAGRAFKAILMNLQQISGVTEDGDVIDASSFNKVEKALAAVGVATSEVRNGLVKLRDPMEVLKDLSEAFVKLDPQSKERADIVSALGGKQRGAQLTALLSNWPIYEKMLSDYNDNAIGSAAAEAEKSAKSWEGSLARVNNSFAQLVDTLVDSGSISALIDLLNGFVQGINATINALGGSNITKLVAFATAFKILKGLLVGGHMLGSVRDVGAAFKRLVDNVRSNYAAARKTAPALKSMQSALKKTKADAIATGGAVKSLHGVLISLASVAGSYLISAAVQWAFDAINDKIHEAERIKEEAEQALSEYDDALAQSRSDRTSANVLVAEYARLSKGVSEHGENMALTSDEYSRYIELSNQLGDMVPSMVSGWDDQGNAIISVRGNIEELNKVLDEYYDKQDGIARAALLESADSILTNARNVYHSEWDFSNAFNTPLRDNATGIATELVMTEEVFEEIALAALDAARAVAADDGLMQHFDAMVADRLEGAVAQYVRETNALQAVLSSLQTEDNLYIGLDGDILFDNIVGDAARIRSIFASVHSSIEDEFDNIRKVFKAAARDSIGYDDLSFSMQGMLDELLASMDMSFALENGYNVHDVGRDINDLIADMLQLQDVLPNAAADVQDFWRSFKNGAIGYGAYTDFAKYIIAQANEISETLGAFIEDYLVGDLTQFEAKYQDMVQRLTRGMTLSDGELEWLNALTMDELTTLYNLKLTTSGNLTLPELWALYEQVKDEPVITQTFSFGDYTDDLENLEKRATALTKLLDGIKDGTLSTSDILGHAQANPDDAWLLEFVSADGSIDMSGIEAKLKEQLKTEYDKLIAELQVYIENMDDSDASKPLIEGFIATLQKQLNEAFAPETLPDINSRLDKYQKAVTAYRTAMIEQLTGQLSPAALSGLYTALTDIGIDAEAYISEGIIQGDTLGAALNVKAAELKTAAAEAGMGEIISDTIADSDEQAMLDAMDSVYDEGVKKIQLLQDIYETISSGEAVGVDKLQELSTAFGADSHLVTDAMSGNLNAFRFAIWNARDTYIEFINTLAGGSDKGASYAQILADGLASSALHVYTAATNMLAQIRLLDEQRENIEKRIDLNNKRGRATSISDYDDLIDNELSRKTELINLKWNAVWERKLYSENSSAWHDATKRIEEYEASIEESAANIIGWHNDILNAFGFEGMSDQLGTLSESLAQIFTEQAGSGVTGKSAAALATWLKSIGENASDYIRSGRGGIVVDNNALRVLAKQTLSDTIAGLREQLASAEPEDRAAIQFNIDLLVNAQTELLDGTSVLAQLDAAYAQLAGEIELVSKAMTESAGETGITTATYRELIKANDSYAAALEYTGGIYRLNTDAVYANLDAKREQILAETEAARATDLAQYEKNSKRIEQLTRGYGSLEDALKSLSGTELSELFDLSNANAGLSDAIAGYNLLSSSLDNATYSYSKWLSAQQGPKGDEWYYAGQDAYQDFLDGIKSGKTGKGTAYAAASELMFGENGVTKQGKKSLERYFKINEDDPEGQERRNMANFYSDLEKMGYLAKTEDGYILNKAIDIGELGKQLGLAEFMIKALFQNAETYGAAIDWNGMYPDLGGAAQDYLTQLDSLVAAAKSKLAELEADGISDEESAEADKLRQIIKVYDDANFSESVSSAQEVLQTEIDGMDAVKLPWIFDAELVAEQVKSLAVAISATLSGQRNIDTESDGISMANAAESIEAELSAITLQLETGDAEGALNRLVGIINQLLAMVGMLTSRNIGDLGASEAASALLRVYDQLRSIDAFRINDKTFAVRAIETGGGVAQAHGTTNASPGTTLVGELKPEMLVRGNRWQLVGRDGAEFVNLKRGDIVIDGDNTERILKGRKGARGTAMARGGMVGGQAALNGVLSRTLAKAKAADIIEAHVADIIGAIIPDTSGSGSSKPSGSGKSSGSNSGASSAKEWLDWIEVKLSRLQRQIDNLIKDADAGIGYLTKNESLSDALDIVIDKIDAAKKAYAEYMEHAEKIANQGKLSPDLIAKVQSGDISIGNYSSSVQSTIQEYQEWYEKALAVKDELYELNELQTELATKKLDNIISSYQQQLDALAGTLELMEGEVDLGIATGKNISESSYESMKANKQAQQQLLTEKRETLQSEFDAAVESGAIKEGSDEWYEYKGEILETSIEINKCAQAVAAYQEEINKLRIMRHEYAADEVGFRRDALEDAITLKKVVGQVVDESDYRPQLELMKEHAQKYGELLNEYRSQLSQVEHGSQKYYELSRNVAQVEADIRALGIEQAELNRLILEMPLQRYENLLEILEGEQSLLQSIMDLHEAQGEYLTSSEYESLISNADKQLANLEAQKKELEGLLAGVQEGSDLWQEYKTQLQGIEASILDIKREQEEWNDSIIDLQIEQLEEQKKLLEEQNEEYERKIELEKAIQELERAKAQRNIQIYREGIGFVWEADQEAIRDAEEALAERRHEEMLDKIDEAIEALDEYKKVDNLYDYFANRINPGSAATRIDYLSNEALGNYIADAVDANSGKFVTQTDAALKKGLTDLVSALKQLSTSNNAPISVGNIYLSGVQDVDSLAHAIINELPGKLTQALYKK